MENPIQTSQKTITLKRKHSDPDSPEDPVDLLKRVKTDPDDEFTDKIQAFCDKHSAVLQGTPEWFDAMRKTIGGSELATLVGANKFATRASLVSKKGGKKVSKAKVGCPQKKGVERGNPWVALTWGKTFESVLRAYVEVVWDTKIFGHDICIIDGQFRFSPDGFGIDKKNATKRIFVVELKCPYSRVLPGGVPDEYKPQLWMGLAATEEINTAYALYVGAVFRKCKLSDLGDNADYDKEYHSRDVYIPYEQKYGNPIAWGVINVYSKDERDYCVDYGGADRTIFDNLFTDIHDGLLVTSPMTLEFADKARVAISLDRGLYNEMHLIGKIPFKMMQVVSQTVGDGERDPEFSRARIMERIDVFFQVVNSTE